MPSEEPAAPEASEEGSADTPGWFRIDTDGLGTQFWVGATHSIGGVDLATDVLLIGTFAEFDIGPSFSFGSLSVLPMVGIGFDFATTDVTTLVAPLLFTIYDQGPLYFESWIQVFFNSITEEMADTGQDYFYTRNFLLYKVNDTVHIGPQAELVYNMNLDDGVASRPVGGRVNIAYGANNTLGLFLGYDDKGVGDKVAGRFTFIRTW